MYPNPGKAVAGGIVGPAIMTLIGRRKARRPRPSMRLGESVISARAGGRALLKPIGS